MKSRQFGPTGIRLRFSSVARQRAYSSSRGAKSSHSRGFHRATFGLWRRSFPDLERAVISYNHRGEAKGGICQEARLRPGRGVWRGPKAPPPSGPSAVELRGSVKTFEIESKALEPRRKLTVYLPPGFEPGKASRVVYAADGEHAERYATVLEPLITAGKIPPVVLVGVHSGGYIGRRARLQELRHEERHACAGVFSGDRPGTLRQARSVFLLGGHGLGRAPVECLRLGEGSRDLRMFERRPICLRDGDAPSGSIRPCPGVLGSRRRCRSRCPKGSRPLRISTWKRARGKGSFEAYTTRLADGLEASGRADGIAGTRGRARRGDLVR